MTSTVRLRSVRLSLALSFATLLQFAASASAIEQVHVCRYCDATYLAAAAEASGDVSPRKYAPDRRMDVTHLKIDVVPDFENRTVAGETTISFTPIAKPLEELRLDAVKLRIEDVTSSHEIADFVSTDEDLTILFKAPIPAGEQASVTVRHSAEPKEGLYFRTAAMGYPEGDDHIWTQGEAHEAPHWFPCFDYPNEKTSTEVICTVPKDMTVLSNGVKQSEEVDEESGLKRVRWLQEKPHTVYLICLVAGHFEKLEAAHNDTPLGFYSQPTLAEHAHNAFQDTEAIMDFFEDEIGVHFPWAKYDQVTIRDFTAGGMENTSLTTLTHRTIHSDATENVRTSYNLDAHEMAHQWFGDLVTCQDWSHLWLNEGFATFYTHLYNEHKFGTDEKLYGLYRDATGRVLSTSDKKPIVYREYSDAMDQFDYRAYPKGSWVLHMLRSQLGEDLYRKGIKTYLERYQFTSVDTANLADVLEEVSGLSLDQFFDQWVYHGGFPALKVDYKWLPKEKLARITIRQTQETGDDVLLYRFPTKLRFKTGDKIVDQEIEVSEREQDFYVPLDEEPEIVRFDPEYTVLATVDFSKSQAMLESQLADASDIIGRLRAVEDLGKKDDQKSLDALAKALNEDAHYGVRTAAASAIAKRQSDKAFEALMASREQADARVRLAVVDALAGYYRDEAKATLIEVAQSEKNPAIIAEAVRGLGKFSQEDANEAIRTALETDSFGNEIASAAVRAIGERNDPEDRELMLRVIREQAQESADSDIGRALPVLAKLWRESDEKTQAREYLDTLLVHPSHRIRESAVRALGQLGDSKSSSALTALADSSNVGMARAAKAALAQLEKEAPSAPQEVSELRTLVRELKEQQEKLQKTVDEMKEMSEAKADEEADSDAADKEDGDEEDDDEEDSSEDSDD